MQKLLGRNTIVLLGIGHTNAHVLKMWKMNPLDNAQLVCISNDPIATYSGMMPGVLAGQYEVPQMEIDLVRLCVSAGARLIIGEVTGIDAENREVHFADRPPLLFDALSIGIGSRPSFRGVELASRSASEEEKPANLVAIKPMQTFLPRLRRRMETLCRNAREGRKGSEPSSRMNIAVVGGGIGSIEVAFCLDQRLKQQPESIGLAADQEYQISLVTGGAQIGSGLNQQTTAKIIKECQRRGISVQVQSRVTQVVESNEFSGLRLKDGSSLPADAVVWATSAVAPPLLSKLGFETDDKGFLLTRSTLQLKSHDRIFAVGDTGTMEAYQLPKAGVYAVRQGPVLWDNLRRLVWNRKLTQYVPQTKFLKLVNTASGSAIAEYGSRAFEGRWCWWLKDRIDRKFMAMYQQYEPMEMKPQPANADPAAAMRCLGCGGKIGSKLLSQVLGELEIPQHDDVLIGLEDPDDAAIVKTANGQVTVTTDFFASPLDDPYLVGKLAMLNSASDCFVMGAQPTSALAIVELPLGHPRAQLQVMRELMAGAVEELRTMGATIVGGHSIEGPRLTAGFTVLGNQLTDPTTKGMLQVGDQLVLTKPLGSGVLLAALMQAQLDGRVYVELIQSMVQSNQLVLELIQSNQVTSATDVTGFGLAGHLIEMLKASKLSANVHIADVPLYPTCRDLLEAGFESTLAPDNRLIVESIEFATEGVSDLDLAPLFDPQTCGGLLLGVQPDACDRLLSKLAEQGCDNAAVIGEVVANSGKIKLTIQ